MFLYHNIFEAFFIFPELFHSPTVVTPMTLRMMVGGAHSTVKASAMYSAKLRQMMANWEGLMMMVDTQLNM